MLPFKTGLDYRQSLIAEAEESTQSAKRLINIQSALSICLLSLCRDEPLPQALSEAIPSESLKEAARTVGEGILADTQPGEGAYPPECFYQPTPERIWPFFVAPALLELEGLACDGTLSAESSPTGEELSVFDTNHADFSNDFLERQIECMNKITETLAPLAEAAAGFVDQRLGLNYDGLSLWPYAHAVITARLSGQDVSKPLKEWFASYWEAALDHEDMLDAAAEMPEPPSRTLH